MERESQKRWDRENMATITCRITRNKADQFKKACEILQTSKSAILIDAINQAIARAEKKSGK